MADISKNYSKIAVSKLPHSEVEITGEIEAAAFDVSVKQALKNLASETDTPGFRKGHVPEKILLQQVGDMAALQRGAELALGQEYPRICEEHGIDPIGSPQVVLTKLAAGNPLGFKIKTAVLPKIDSIDYKKIAKDVLSSSKNKNIEVGENEINEVILEFKKNYAAAQKTPPANTKELPPEQAKKETPVESTDEELIKLFGVKNISDLKSKIKENLIREKAEKNKSETRAALGEALIAKASIDVPEILVESELAKMLARFKDDILRAGLTYENYLSQIKKNEDDIRKEWRSGAEKKAKLQLLIHKIAELEKIIPPAEEIEPQMKHVLEHNKKADPLHVRAYVEMIITNEKVFEFLENSPS